MLRTPFRARSVAGGLCAVVALTGAGIFAAVAAASPASALSTESHVDNVFSGATGYVNPEWKAKAESVSGGSRVSNTSTAVWLDRIAAIEGTPNSSSNGAMGLRDHLDAALAQQNSSGKRVVAQFVIYDLRVATALPWPQR